MLGAIISVLRQVIPRDAVTDDAPAPIMLVFETLARAVGIVNEINWASVAKPVNGTIFGRVVFFGNEEQIRCITVHKFLAVGFRLDVGDVFGDHREGSAELHHINYSFAKTEEANEAS